MEDDIEVRLAAAGDTLAVDALAARVFRTFRAEGLECRLLKGASFASWLYDASRPRTYVDCDFLLPPADIDAAERILASRAFTPYISEFMPGDRPWYHTSWADPATNTLVELHRTLVGAHAPPEVVWRILSEPKESVVVAGEEVDALSVPGRLLHVALHAAQHGPEHLKCADDLSRALRKSTFANWQMAADLAARIDATDAFSFGLRCGAEGRRVAAGLGLPESASTEMKLRTASPPHLALGFEWLSHQRGVTAKAAFVAHKLFPPRAALRQWIVMIRRRPLPLPAAYVWRIGWLVKRAPAGYRAWRMAKRGEP